MWRCHGIRAGGKKAAARSRKAQLDSLPYRARRASVLLPGDTPRISDIRISESWRSSYHRTVIELWFKVSAKMAGAVGGEILLL